MSYFWRNIPTEMHPMFDNKMNRYFREQGKPFPVVVWSYSGGKDSTFCILQAVDQGLPMDVILWYDTGWEFPEMYDHMNKLFAWVKERRPNVVCVKLKSKRSLDDRMMNYLWPAGKNRWCTAEKKACIRRWYASEIFAKGFELIEVIGYAAEEEDRMIAKEEEKTHSKIWKSWFPMSKDEWNCLEPEALSYCEEKGFKFGGLYKNYHRVSCFCCPQSSRDELRVLRQSSPDLWQRMLDMEKRMPAALVKDGKVVRNTFKWNKTLKEIDQEFATEVESTLFPVQYTKKVRRAKTIKKKPSQAHRGQQMAMF